MKHRENFKKWLQESPVDHGVTDDLDRKAVEGFQYLDEGSSLDESMERLDQRFESLLDEQPLTSVDTEKKAQAVVRPLMRQRRWMGVAAAILLLVLPTLYFLNKPANSAQLFANHFETPRSPYLLTSRGEADQNMPDLTSAFTLYEQGDHEQALPAIRELITKYPQQEDLTYYAGVSALASEMPEDAIALFKQAQQTQYQKVDEKSAYFLGLSYLKLGDLEQASQWLKKAESGVYGEKAKNLAKELE